MAPREEDEHGQHGAAVVRDRVVEQAAGLGHEQDRSDSGEDDEREHGLLARLHVYFGLVAQGGEDVARRLEDGDRPQPPLLLAARPGGRGRLGVHGVRLSP